MNRMLDDLGVTPGRVILVHSDISGVPLPKIKMALTREGVDAHRLALCAFLLDVLMERLGTDGTLVVPTFSYTTTKQGHAFHQESTPSEVGPFSEFVRRQPTARRSLHPIFSLAAIGRHAAEIVDNCGPAAFGRMSPWARMADLDGRIITLGVPFTDPTTYVHHVEQCFGVPHRFHKVLEIPVFQNGKQVEGTWLAYLRYRSVDIGPDLRRLQDRLRATRRLAETAWNNKASSAVDMKDFDDIAYPMLCDDPWVFASRRSIMRITETVPLEGPAQTPVVDLELRPAS